MLCQQIVNADDKKQQKMKSLKNVVKRSPSPKSTARQVDAQPLISQRSKNSCHNIYKKYNQANIPSSKQSIFNSKYRIVTEPVDDRMAQISKSYTKLAPSKRKEGRIQSNHVSIKNRQKSIPAQKEATHNQIPCVYCKAYQNELLCLKEQISSFIILKQRWKQGEIVTDDVLRQTAKTLQFYRDKDIYKPIQDLRRHIVDLMKDIEALTQIDYPKLISYKAFDYMGLDEGNDEEEEIKLLLAQLRAQIDGKITLFDFQQEFSRENLKLTIRNLKANIAKYLRQNLQLRTKLTMTRRESKAFDEDIRRVVADILRGLK